MLKNIIEKVGEEISGENIKDTVAEINHLDRWFSFSKFHQSAQLCQDMMKRIGLKQVEIFPFPADGKTKIGDHIIPEAWDAGDAELQVIFPDGYLKTIASYKENPCSLFMYSASTPAKGIEAEIVSIRGNREEDYKKIDVEGKVIFTSLNPQSMWRLAEKFGAIGIVTDMSERKPLQTGIHWENYCFVPDNKNKLFGFSISHNTGKYLRKLIVRAKKKRENLKVKVKIKTKSDVNKIDTITGLIPGKNPKEEIIVFAHLNEIGAWDNASGSAATLEIARVLKKLISQRKLPQPKRSIRFMLGWECYSLMIYLIKKKKKTTNTIAGLTIDGIGVDPFKFDAPLGIHGTPEANPSYVDILLEEIAGSYLKDKTNLRIWESFPFAGGDSLPSDPYFNIPMPYLYQPCRQIWHNSVDTMDKLEPEVLKWAATIGGTYLYYLANAGYEEAKRLAGEVYLRWPQVLSQVSRNIAREKVAYLKKREIFRLHSVEKLVSEKNRKKIRMHVVGMEKQMGFYTQNFFISSYIHHELTALEKKASLMIPKRLVPGILTLETLPAEVKATCKWGPAYHVLVRPVFWTDGKRNLLEISQLLKQEIGKEIDLKDFVDCYEFLEKYGYVQIKRMKIVEVTKKTLRRDLRRLGFAKGDIVLVHSSLKAIGHVVGGPDTVIDTLLEVVGKRGTVAMPTFSWNFCRSQSPPFDPDKSPSKVGVISEVFRLRKNAIRSKQSTHSVAAIGPKARYITEGHENLTPYSKKGPFGKLVELDSYILFLGCGMTSNSTLHAVEDWMNMPYLNIAESPILLDKDEETKIINIRKEPFGHRDFYNTNSKVEKYLKKTGIIKHGMVGNAEVQLVRAKDLVEKVMKQMKKEPDLLLCDNPDCKFCSEWKKKLKK